jgi:hypothetical protein
MIASSGQFGLRFNQHWIQVGLDNKETLWFGNREMNRLPEFKSVSANTHLTDSKSNLKTKVYFDSAKTVIKKAAYMTKSDKNSKL